MKIEINKSQIWCLFLGFGLGFSSVYLSMGNYIMLFASLIGYILVIVIWLYLLKYICKMLKIKNFME